MRLALKLFELEGQVLVMIDWVRSKGERVETYSCVFEGKCVAVVIDGRVMSAVGEKTRVAQGQWNYNTLGMCVGSAY